MKTALLSLALALGSLAPAAASARGSACKADVQRFCSGVRPGGGRIVRCLRSHETELSEPCKAEREAVRERAEKVHQACAEDAARLCKDVAPGGGRIVRCMRQHRDQVSEGCKTAMAAPRR
jgi:hypothetical protein